MTAVVRRAADRPAQPWRNGGGVTRDVARYPETGEFDWRVSVADIDRDGAFSTFEGVDRVIVLVEGEAMTLTVSGVDHALSWGEPFGFDGGQPTSCCLPGPPTRDLNVMTRRGRARSAVDVVQIGSAPVAFAAAGPLLLVALSGPVSVTSSAGLEVELGVLDALEWRAAASVRVAGPGTVVAIHVAPW